MTELAYKIIKTLKQEGFLSFIRKTKNFIIRKYSKVTVAKKICADVLFINGCSLPHPYRYRVQHQREQLAALGMVSDEIYYTELTCDCISDFRTIIIYRCPLTPMIKNFIEKARYFNKKVFFDIDDLVIDTVYTDLIPYVANMSDEDKKLYDSGVQGYRDTLLLCDAVITTTERLAQELKKYKDNVFVNRNTASEMMVALSAHAVKEVKKDDNTLIIGYFSGSITHNDDLEMIAPVLASILEAYQQVKLMIVGELTLPPTLHHYEDQIIFSPFIEWIKLPALIAKVDINIVPLLDNIFNEAKSENKWIEASLVKVPTVASNIGAFKRMIKHNITGLLCTNISDWENSLKTLLDNKQLRYELAENAYKDVSQNCLTINTGLPLWNFIVTNRAVNLAMLLPSTNISGGILVALKHCDILRRNGYDVTAINMDKKVLAAEHIYYAGNEISCVIYESKDICCSFDKVVATMWLTNKFFSRHNLINERYYLVQNFETDFYPHGTLQRIEANSTYCQNQYIKYVTISKWCRAWLDERFGVAARYAPNGIERKLFYPRKRDWQGKIRILIEGDSESAYKNVDESFQIAALLDEKRYEIWYISYNGEAKKWYRVDKFLHKVAYEKMPEIYRSCHILLKSSILESFSYPPLEMMATGGLVIVRENEGNREYLRHGVNCLLYDQRDLFTAVHFIETVCSDTELRLKLYEGGQKTADERDWINCQGSVLKLYGFGCDR